MNKHSKDILVIYTLLLAFSLQVIISPLFESYDASEWRNSIKYALTYGIHSSYDFRFNPVPGTGKYPPLFFYTIKAVGVAYGFLFPQLHMDTNTLVLVVLMKIPLITAEMLASFVIFYFILKSGRGFKLAYICMVLYAFNPAIIYSTAYDGLWDSIYACLALMSIVFLTGGSVGWSWLFITLSFLHKPQGIVFVPIIVAYTFMKYGLKGVYRGFTVMLCVSLIVSLPFIYFKTLRQLGNAILKIPGSWPNPSVRAYNLWWLLTLAKDPFGGDAVSDTERIYDIISYRNSGFILYSILYLFALYVVYGATKRGINKTSPFISSCFLVAFGFFMLLTGGHSNYLYPTITILPLVILEDKRLMWIYLVLSTTFILNYTLPTLWASVSSQNKGVDVYHTPLIGEPLRRGVLSAIAPAMPNFITFRSMTLLLSAINLITLVYSVYVVGDIYAKR